jgi:hydroxymethylpyrimidine/phosphomethylpyrimidine kinase
VSADPLVVSVHALETGAGEGFVADAAVLAELECRAACVATSVLVPEPLPLNVVARQLENAASRGPIGAFRIGFLRGAAQAELVGHVVGRAPLSPAVLAMPLRAGAATLLDAETRDAMMRFLVPAARVTVVRAADVASLVDREIDSVESLRDAALRLRARGAQAVVIAGWLWRGRVVDLVSDDDAVVLLDTTRIQAQRIPGLSGAYAAALAAHLARGLTLPFAADAAQRFIGLRLARGR